MQGSISTQNSISPGHVHILPNASLFPNNIQPGIVTQPGAAAFQLNAINYLTHLVKGDNLPHSGFGQLTGIVDHGTNY